MSLSKSMTEKFRKAFNFLFYETYLMWEKDMSKIFRIGTRGTKGGCNLASCIIVLIGIESFSKFFSEKNKAVEAFVDFTDRYYPPFYRGKMKKVYKLFRHGLAHNYYPKSEFDLINTTTITFGINDQKMVVSLSRVKQNLDEYRRKVLKLEPLPGSPYVIAPQVLFLDTVDVMESLKIRIQKDAKLQAIFIKNHKKIRKILRHPV